jgi:NADP-dependent 3-hydroxy acid dehydrogenase YdfG
LAFAREGASVVGSDASAEAAESTVDTIRGEGGAMVSMQPCRLTQPADCQALVDLAVHTFGRIDVLFNLAAVSWFNWLEDITDEEWDRARREEVDLFCHRIVEADRGARPSGGASRRGRRIEPRGYVC